MKSYNFIPKRHVITSLQEAKKYIKNHWAKYHPELESWIIICREEAYTANLDEEALLKEALKC